MKEAVLCCDDSAYVNVPYMIVEHFIFCYKRYFKFYVPNGRLHLYNNKRISEGGVGWG